MAVFGELQIGRVLRFLTKWANLKGSQGPIVLGSEVSAAIPYFSGRENRWLDSWKTFAVKVQAPAVAAQNSTVRLNNPKGSNEVAVIEKILVETSVADGSLGIGYDTPALGDLTVVGGIALDARGDKSTQIHPSQGNNQAGPTLIGSFGVAANAAQDYIFTDIQELPLLPNSTYSIQTAAVNVILTVSFIWRSRTLEDSELT